MQGSEYKIPGNLLRHVLPCNVEETPLPLSQLTSRATQRRLLSRASAQTEKMNRMGPERVRAKPPHFPGVLGFPLTENTMGKKEGEQEIFPFGHSSCGTARRWWCGIPVPSAPSKPLEDGCLQGVMSWTRAWRARVPGEHT